MPWPQLACSSMLGPAPLFLHVMTVMILLWPFIFQDAALKGSPVDGSGRSTARVFYNLMQLGGSWVYTYNLYYS